MQWRTLTKKSTDIISDILFFVQKQLLNMQYLSDGETMLSLLKLKTYQNGANNKELFIVW